MNVRNFSVVSGRMMMIVALLFHAAIGTMAQSSRPRYSHSQATQSPDTIPVDTVIRLRMNTYLSSKSAHVGDTFTATVTDPVMVNGFEALPPGATITGRVTQVVPAKRMNKSGMIALDFNEISLPNGLSTQIVGVLTSDDPTVEKMIDDENRMSGGKGKDAAVFIGGSGILGAILGGVSGGAKGAAVGGAVGAGVGLASVLLSKGEEAMVPAGTEFGLRLKQPLPVPNAANTYDPAVDNSVDRSAPGNSSQANPPDSSAEVRAQASRNSDREVENTSRTSERLPQPSDSDVASTPPPTNTSRDSEAQPTTADESRETQPREEDLPLDSVTMIRRAQQALREEGYYEGAVDGVLTPRFENSLKTYQREHNLPQTGRLDLETAKSLRIVGASRAVASSQRTPSSARQSSSANPSNPSPARPTVERPSVSTSTEDSSAVPSSSRERSRQPTIETSSTQNQSVSQTQGATTSSAAKLQRQAADLLAEYQRLIGVRLTGTGMEMSGKAVYTDDEISLLYAFDSFANSTQLYSRLLPSLQSQQGLRSATLAMAREARKTDKIFTTSANRWANALNPRWDAIRQEVLKLMYVFSINTAELDY
ncbi:MAG: peptidoglycan-binding protein [Acidobacteria bacterium]|nr:peptidoglycan-binding protein [Acidobacteriota bacterium]